jgi:peptidoglycan hydrolase-like protein with peptidoglycan-binding domain
VVCAVVHKASPAALLKEIVMAVKTFLGRGTDGRCEAIDFEDIPSESELSISAPVGVGGRNVADDVRTIQQALNEVPASAGGPVPPLAVDGIAGPKTQRAISTFQLKQLGWADGRVDTDNVTIARLRQLQGGAPGDSGSGDGASGPPAGKAGKRVSAAPVKVPHNPFIMPQVYASLPDVRSWIFRAQIVLDRAGDFLAGLSTSDTELQRVNKYFHLNKMPKPQAAAAIRGIHGLYSKMRTCVVATTLGLGFFQEDPTARNNPKGKHVGYTFFGGFTRKNPKTGRPRMSVEDHYAGPNLREDTIFICTDLWPPVRNELYVTWIIHELAHFVGPEVDQPGRITDQGDIYFPDPRFFKLDAHRALHHADCYAEFAADCVLGHPVASNVINLAPVVIT